MSRLPTALPRWHCWLLPQRPPAQAALTLKPGPRYASAATLVRGGGTFCVRLFGKAVFSPETNHAGCSSRPAPSRLSA